MTFVITQLGSFGLQPVNGCVECGLDFQCDFSDEHELRRCDGCGWPVCSTCGPGHIKNEDGYDGNDQPDGFF